MEYDSERAYPESEWAAQRWDWFHGGRIVEPLSFCHFWRTVLVWATIKWLVSPLIWLDRVTSGLTLPTVPMPSIPWRFALLPVKGCWLVLREGAGGLWRLTYPLRCIARPVGGAALAGAVKIGQPIEDSYQRHKTGLDRAKVAFGILFYGVVAVLILILAFLASWFWTLIVAGAIAAITVGGFAVYGFAKSGAGALVWQAMIVVHHGICPPIRIVRS